MLAVLFEHLRFIYRWQRHWRTQDMAKGKPQAGGLGAKPMDYCGFHIKITHFGTLLLLL